MRFPYKPHVYGDSGPNGFQSWLFKLVWKRLLKNHISFSWKNGKKCSCDAQLLLISSCTQEIAAIVAMLQVENVFLQSGHHQSGKARMAKRKFEVKEGDLLTLLNVYRFKPFFFISRFYPLSSSWSFNRSWTRWLASPLELWQPNGLDFWSLVNGCLSNTPKI